MRKSSTLFPLHISIDIDKNQEANKEPQTIEYKKAIDDLKKSIQQLQDALKPVDPEDSPHQRLKASLARKKEELRILNLKLKDLQITSILSKFTASEEKESPKEIITLAHGVLEKNPYTISNALGESFLRVELGCYTCLYPQKLKPVEFFSKVLSVSVDMFRELFKKLGIDNINSWPQKQMELFRTYSLSYCIPFDKENWNQYKPILKLLTHCKVLGEGPFLSEQDISDLENTLNPASYAIYTSAAAP